MDKTYDYDEVLKDFLVSYSERLRLMPANDICEEYSFLFAVETDVTSNDDGESLASLLLGKLYQICVNQIMARVINKSLEPYDV